MVACCCELVSHIVRVGLLQESSRFMNKFDGFVNFT